MPLFQQDEIDPREALRLTLLRRGALPTPEEALEITLSKRRDQRQAFEPEVEDYVEEPVQPKPKLVQVPMLEPDAAREAAFAETQRQLRIAPERLPEPPPPAAPTPLHALQSGAEQLIGTGGRLIQGAGEYLQAPRTVPETSPAYLKYGMRERPAPAPVLGEAMSEKGRSIAEAAKKRQESVPRPTVDFMDSNASVTDRLDSFAYSVAEGLMSSVPPLVGGAVGYAVGGKPGAAYGAMLPAYLQNRDELEQKLLAGGASKELASKVASIGAIPIAAADALPAERLFSRVFGRDIRDWAIRTVFSDLAKQGAFEGVTESTQEAIGSAITQHYTGTAMSWSEIVKAGLVGAGVGAVTGGLASPLTTMQAVKQDDAELAAHEQAMAAQAQRRRREGRIDVGLQQTDTPYTTEIPPLAEPPATRTGDLVSPRPGTFRTPEQAARDEETRRRAFAQPLTPMAEPEPTPADVIRRENVRRNLEAQESLGLEEPAGATARPLAAPVEPERLEPEVEAQQPSAKPITVYRGAIASSPAQGWVFFSQHKNIAELYGGKPGTVMYEGETGTVTEHVLRPNRPILASEQTPEPVLDALRAHFGEKWDQAVAKSASSLGLSPLEVASYAPDLGTILHPGSYRAHKGDQSVAVKDFGGLKVPQEVVLNALQTAGYDAVRFGDDEWAALDRSIISPASAVESQTAEHVPLARQERGVRHGTDVGAALGILTEGLRPGSSVSQQGGRDYEGYPVTLEFGKVRGAKDYSSPYGPTMHTGAATVGGADANDITRVFFDPSDFLTREDAEESYQQLRQGLDEAGRQDLVIEGVQYNEDSDERPYTYGGPVSFEGNRTEEEYLEQYRRRQPRTPQEMQRLQKDMDNEITMSVDALFAAEDAGNEAKATRLRNKLNRLYEIQVERGFIEPDDAPKAAEPQTKQAVLAGDKLAEQRAQVDLERPYTARSADLDGESIVGDTPEVVQRRARYVLDLIQAEEFPIVELRSGQTMQVASAITNEQGEIVGFHATPQPGKGLLQAPTVSAADVVQVLVRRDAVEPAPAEPVIAEPVSQAVEPEPAPVAEATPVQPEYGRTVPGSVEEKVVTDPGRKYWHTIDDIKNIAEGRGTVIMYHGTTREFAERLLEEGPKLRHWTETMRYFADLYGIPYVQMKQVISEAMYPDVKTVRLSTAPGPIAARWATHFGIGEANDIANSNARMIKAAKRLGISVDEATERAYQEAERLGKRATMINVADFLEEPNLFLAREHEGALVAGDVDARAFGDRARSEAKSVLKQLERGESTLEQAIEGWNSTYIDAHIDPRHFKNTRVVETGALAESLPKESFLQQETPETLEAPPAFVTPQTLPEPEPAAPTVGAKEKVTAEPSVALELPFEGEVFEGETEVKKPRITAAAIKTADGRFFTGSLHYIARDAAEDAGVSTKGSIDGWWTQNDRFLTREEGEPFVRQNQPAVAQELDRVRQGLPDTQLDSQDFDAFLGKAPKGEVTLAPEPAPTPTVGPAPAGLPEPEPRRPHAAPRRKRPKGMEAQVKPIRQAIKDGRLEEAQTAVDQLEETFGGPDADPNALWQIRVLRASVAGRDTRLAGEETETLIDMAIEVMRRDEQAAETIEEEYKQWARETASGEVHTGTRKTRVGGRAEKLLKIDESYGPKLYAELEARNVTPEDVADRYESVKEQQAEREAIEEEPERVDPEFIRESAARPSKLVDTSRRGVPRPRETVSLGELGGELAPPPFVQPSALAEPAPRPEAVKAQQQLGDLLRPTAMGERLIQLQQLVKDGVITVEQAQQEALNLAEMAPEAPQTVEQAPGVPEVAPEVEEAPEEPQTDLFGRTSTPQMRADRIQPSAERPLGIAGAVWVDPSTAANVHRSEWLAALYKPLADAAEFAQLVAPYWTTPIEGRTWKFGGVSFDPTSFGYNAIRFEIKTNQIWFNPAMAYASAMHGAMSGSFPESYVPRVAAGELLGTLIHELVHNTQDTAFKTEDEWHNSEFSASLTSSMSRVFVFPQFQELVGIVAELFETQEFIDHYNAVVRDWSLNVRSEQGERARGKGHKLSAWWPTKQTEAGQTVADRPSDEVGSIAGSPSVSGGGVRQGPTAASARSTRPSHAATRGPSGPVPDDQGQGSPTPTMGERELTPEVYPAEQVPIPLEAGAPSILETAPGGPPAGVPPTKRVGVGGQGEMFRPKEEGTPEPEPEPVNEDEQRQRAVKHLQRAAERARRLNLRPEYAVEVDAALDDIDLKQMTAKTKKLLEGTKAFLDEHPDADVPLYVRQSVERLSKQQLGDMSLVDILDTTNAVELAVHLSQFKNALLGRQRGRMLDKTVSRIVSEMEANKEPLKTEGKLKAKRSQISLFLREFSTRPETLMMALSETMANLVWGDIGVHGYRDELQRAQSFQDALSQTIRDIGFSDFGTSKQSNAFEKWRQQELSLTTPDGDYDITRDEAVWLLAQLKSPENAEKLARDGVTLDRLSHRKTVIPGKSTPHFFMTPDVVEQIERLTGDGEKRLAQHIFDSFNGGPLSMKRLLNEAWVSVYGYEIAQVPNYMPQNLDVSGVDTNLDPLAKYSAALEATITSWKHLRPREGSQAPMLVRSGMDAYVNHVRHVARISANLASVKNAHTLLGRADIRQSIIERVGEEGYLRIVNSISDQVVPRHTTKAEQFARQRLRMIGAATLGIRLSTVMLAPANLFVSAGYIGPKGYKYLAKALNRVTDVEELSRIDELAREISPYYRERYEQFVREATSSMTGERASSYGTPDLAEYSMKPLEWADRKVAAIRWLMVEQLIDETQPGLQGDERNEAIALEWEKLMYRSDNTGHGLEMTGAIAYGREHVAFAPFVMFMSSVSKTYSLAVRSIDLAATRKNATMAITAMSGVAASTLYVMVVRELISRARGDDEKEEDWRERLLQRAITEAAGYIPVIGQPLLVPIIRRMFGQGSMAYSANMIDDIIAKTRDSGMALVSAINKAYHQELNAKGEPAFWADVPRFLEGMTEVSAALIGVPFAGLRDYGRMGNNLINMVSHDATPAVKDYLKELQQDTDVTQERRRLLQAIQLNDPDKFRLAVLGLRGRTSEQTGEPIVRVTSDEIMATINRRYGQLSRFEPGEPARDRVPPETLSYIDDLLAERDSLLDIARELIAGNRDVVARSPGRGRRRPTRPSRARR